MIDHPAKSPSSVDVLREADSPTLTPMRARELTGQAPMVRIKLAANPVCPVDVLASLATDVDSTVRTSALSNLLTRDEAGAFAPAVDALAGALTVTEVPVHLRARIATNPMLPADRVRSALATDDALASAVAARSGVSVRPRVPQRPGRARSW